MSTQYKTVALSVPLQPGPVERVAVTAYAALHETNSRLIEENEYLRNAAIRWCERARVSERRATFLWLVLVSIGVAGLVLIAGLAALPGLLAWWMK